MTPGTRGPALPNYRKGGGKFYGEHRLVFRWGSMDYEPELIGLLVAAYRGGGAVNFGPLGDCVIVQTSIGMDGDLVEFTADIRGAAREMKSA